jgi:hypothetical protein
MGNLRIGPYFAFLSKFWVVGHVITRSRTASGYVDGADDLLRSGLGRRARGRNRDTRRLRTLSERSSTRFYI